MRLDCYNIIPTTLVYILTLRYHPYFLILYNVVAFYTCLCSFFFY